MDDLDEWKYFGALTQGANGDYDEDGATNKDELDKGKDPTDPEEYPVERGVEEEGGSNILMIIAIIVVILIMVPILIMVMRSKQMKAQEDEKITEMEAKIEKMKKMGLPTRDLEKVLKEAMEGRGGGDSDESKKK
jgi:hypothetical protein